MKFFHKYTQSRSEHFKKRELQAAAERSSEATRDGYSGPDGSGQWVSMGELGHGDGALDAALNDIPTGGHIISNPIHVFNDDSDRHGGRGWCSVSQNAF